MDREPSAPLKVFLIQLTCSPVAYGHGLCTHELKLTGESEKAPVPSAVTPVEVSTMFTLLQGSAMEGRRASSLMSAGGSGGAIAA